MTGRTIGVGLAIPALAALSYVIGYEVLAVFAAAGTVLVIVAALSVIRPPGANLERTIEPTQVTRGETANVTLGRRNRSPVPAAPLEAIDRIGHLTVEVRIPLAPPGSGSDASYRFVTTRRGQLQIGPARLLRRDPWGLFQRTREVGGVGELLVYPRVLPMAAPEIVTRLGRDASAADVAAGSDRFHTLREYVPGDELRKVHWPSSARTGTMMVKQMVDAPQPRLMLYLDCDTSAYPRPEDFEEAVDIAASLAQAIVATGVDLIACSGGTQRTVEITRRDDLQELLDILALVEAEPTASSAVKLRGLVMTNRATALLGITGPGNGFLASLTGVRSLIGEASVFRVGTSGQPSTTRRPGLVINDAPTADDFARLFALRSAPKNPSQ